MVFERTSIEPHTKTYLGGDMWRFTTRIPGFHGRKRPLPVYITASHNDLAGVKDIYDSLSLVSVQRRLWKDLNARKGICDQIDRIEISTDFGKDLKTIESIMASSSSEIISRAIKMSFYQAEHLRGDKLAWVLSGGSTRGLAYPHIFKYCVQHNLSPDFIFGTSAGGALGAKFAQDPDPDKLIYLTKKIVSYFGHQDFVDINFRDLKDLSTYKAPIHGQYLKDIFEIPAGLRGLYYSGMKKPFFSIGVRKGSGQTVVFGDPKYKAEMKGGSKLFPSIYVNHDYPVVNGLMATCSIPGVMPPFDVNCDPVRTIDGEFVKLPPEYQIDGGVRQNLAVGTVAQFKEIGEVLAFYLGFSGDKDDNDENCLQTVVRAFGIASIPQLDILESDRMMGVNIRVINPSFDTNMGVFAGLEKAQMLGLSAVDGINRIILRSMEGMHFNRDELFRPLTIEQRRRLEEIVEIGEGFGDNVLYYKEKDPLINHPDSKRMLQLITDDGGRVIPKSSTKSTAHWLYDQMVEQFGWPRATILAANAYAEKLILNLLFRE